MNMRLVESRTIFSEMSTPEKGDTQGNQKFFGTCHRSQGARFTGARAIGCIGAWGVGVERDPGSLL